MRWPQSFDLGKTDAVLYLVLLSNECDLTSFFRILLNREFNPMKAVFVETINGEHAARSVYSKAFKEFGFFVNYNGLELRKRY